MKKSTFIFFIFLSSVFSQKNELKNLKVLSYTKKSDVVKYMKVISKELGVKCSFCHITNDYSNDKKDHKKVAREMIIMTMNANKTMNTLNFHEISCWVCHRGNNHPLHPPSKK